MRETAYIIYPLNTLHMNYFCSSVSQRYFLNVQSVRLGLYISCFWLHLPEQVHLCQVLSFHSADRNVDAQEKNHLESVFQLQCQN